MKIGTGLVLVLLAGCASAPPAEQERTVWQSFTSDAVADGWLHESPDRLLAVYLPPSYYSYPDRRFPVVYFIHGFGDSYSTFPYEQDALDQAMTATGCEFIMVFPDAGNQLGGSFLVNSPATGRFEDFIVQELVPWIDKEYRTVARAEARGIGGFSMGGFASLNLAFRHPSVFGSVLAFSPGALKTGSLRRAVDSWDRTFLSAYGAAFAPRSPEDPSGPVPAFDGSAADKALIAQWESGFGNLEGKILSYQASGAGLSAISLWVGDLDQYGWLYEGTVEFSKLLNQAGITHTLTVAPGGRHVLPVNWVTERLVPFFAPVFAGQTS